MIHFEPLYLFWVYSLKRKQNLRDLKQLSTDETLRKEADDFTRGICSPDASETDLNFARA